MENWNPPTPPSVSPELDPPTPSPTPSGLQSIFVFPNGIRAGWRLLIFIAMAIILAVILIAPARLLRQHAPPGGLSGPIGVMLGEGLPFLAALLSAAVMARIEGRSLADYALPARGAFGSRFWRGAIWGFVALTALLLAIRADQGFSFGSVVPDGSNLAFYGVGWALAFLLVGFAEEFIFRGYALYTLSTGIGFWPAAILLSVVFGSIHLQNGGESWVGAAAAGLIGLFFCFTVRRTGDLWFAIGLHAAWDYAESFVYSVPDSGAMVPGHLLSSSFHGPRWLTGGTVGPEGSALVFVVIAVLFVVFGWLHREVRFPAAARPLAGNQHSAISNPQPSAADPSSV